LLLYYFMKGPYTLEKLIENPKFEILHQRQHKLGAPPPGFFAPHRCKYVY